MVTSRIANAAETLIRRMDSPAAITEALQALLAGDLTQPQDELGDAAALAPFYPPGKTETRASCLLCCMSRAALSCGPVSCRNGAPLPAQRQQRPRVSRARGWLTC